MVKYRVLCVCKRKSKRNPKKSARTGNTPKKDTTRHRHSSNPNGRNELKLEPEEREKLETLRTDGIIILIDQANLETGMRERKKKKDPHWALSYHRLRRIIQQGKGLKHRRHQRDVLKTYLVTSKQHQVSHGALRDSYVKKYDIDVIRSPDTRATREKGKKVGEKAVDSALVRIMTQHFEGIEMLRLHGKKPPNRTFCLVAGDYDYIDVVQQARESGCDVELWYWINEDEMADGWVREENRVRCWSRRCGQFIRVDLEPHEKKLRTSNNVDNSAFCSASSLSREIFIKKR